MFVTNCISTTKIQKISEITNFFRHYFLSRTEVLINTSMKKLTKNHPSARWMIFFWLLPHWSQPSGEPFSFTCKAVSPMVGCSLFSTLSPVFLHARRCCVFRKHGETAQEQSFSSLQSSIGERSNIF